MSYRGRKRSLLVSEGVNECRGDTLGVLEKRLDDINDLISR